MNKTTKNRINFMVKYLVRFLSFFLIFTSGIIQGQTSLLSGSYNFNSAENIPFRADEKKMSKSYWLPAAEVVGLNFFVLTYNEYLTKEGWANISLQSASDNIKYGFTWDSDGFMMNQFYHPYHGASYFNAARSNGLNFWESIPYAFGGSLMWEYFMEIERPSYNDLLNTTISGITLGEITYRVSNLIIDESSRGGERVIRELVALVINPMHTFNRALKGKPWKLGTKHKKKKTEVNLAIGTNTVFINRNFQNNYFYLMLKFGLRYGDKFKSIKHNKPFEYFRVHSEVSFTEGNNIIGISASGVLWDENFKAFNTNRNIMGLYKEFDLLFNSIYKFSASSLTGEISNLIKLSANCKIQNSLGSAIVLIGSSNSKYSVEVERDYNLGPGLGFRFFSDLYVNDSWIIFFKYKQFWIHVLNGVDGDEFIGLFNLGVNYYFNKILGVGMDAVFYERYGIYRTLPDIYSKNASLRVYLKYTFL